MEKGAKKADRDGIIHGQLQMFYILIFMPAMDRASGGTIIVLLRVHNCEDTIKGQPSSEKWNRQLITQQEEIGPLFSVRCYDFQLILYLLKISVNFQWSSIFCNEQSCSR